jgi:Exportin 1-like protein
MKEWKDVVPSIVSALGSDAGSHACILEFLRVLPEEVTEGRKITLTVRGPKDTSLRASTLRVRYHTRIKV